MQEWACYSYEEKTEDIELKAEMESSWFHDILLAHLIENNEFSLLRILLGNMPNQRLTGISHLLITIHKGIN